MAKIWDTVLGLEFARMIPNPKNFGLVASYIAKQADRKYGNIFGNMFGDVDVKEVVRSKYPNFDDMNNAYLLGLKNDYYFEVVKPLIERLNKGFKSPDWAYELQPHLIAGDVLQDQKLLAATAHVTEKGIFENILSHIQAYAPQYKLAAAAAIATTAAAYLYNKYKQGVSKKAIVADIDRISKKVAEKSLSKQRLTNSNRSKSFATKTNDGLKLKNGVVSLKVKQTNAPGRMIGNHSKIRNTTIRSSLSKLGRPSSSSRISGTSSLKKKIKLSKK